MGGISECKWTSSACMVDWIGMISLKVIAPCYNATITVSFKSLRKSEYSKQI